MNAQTFVMLDNYRDKLTDFIKSTKVKNGDTVDLTIEQFVNQKLPEIISLAQTVMADGRLDFFELVRIVTFTSTAVRDSLDIYTKANITEKLAVVREIIQFLVNELYAGESSLKDYVLDDKNLDGLINLVYKLLVKFRR